jgi:hypothetical protein
VSLECGGVGIQDLPDAFGIAKRGGDRQVACRTSRDEQSCDGDITVSPTTTPAGQVDRLKIGPESAFEAACRAVNRVHIGATVE